MLSIHAFDCKILEKTVDVFSFTRVVFNVIMSIERHKLENMLKERM